MKRSIPFTLFNQIQNTDTHADVHVHRDSSPPSANTSRVVSLLPPCQTDTASGSQSRRFFGRWKCNLRFRNEFICQKNIICRSAGCSLLPEHLLSPALPLPCGVAGRRRACRDTGRLQILSPLPSRIRLHPFFNLACWETRQHSQWGLYDPCQVGARDEYSSPSHCVLTIHSPTPSADVYITVAPEKIMFLERTVSQRGNSQGCSLWFCTINTDCST